MNMTINYLYAIRDKSSKKLINKKCNKDIFYIRESFARNKLNPDREELVKFKLVEVEE